MRAQGCLWPLRCPVTTNQQTGQRRVNNGLTTNQPQHATTPTSRSRTTQLVWSSIYKSLYLEIYHNLFDPLYTNHQFSRISPVTAPLFTRITLIATPEPHIALSNIQPPTTTAAMCLFAVLHFSCGHTTLNFVRCTTPRVCTRGEEARYSTESRCLECWEGQWYVYSFNF